MTKPVDNLPPVHPGRILRRELAARKLSAEDFADKISVPHDTITRILNEGRGISPLLAVRLAKVFDMTPEFWLNLQDIYDMKSGNLPRPRYNLTDLLAKCDLTIPLSEEDREWTNLAPVGREIGEPNWRAQRAADVLKIYEERHPELATSMEHIVDTFLVDLVMYCELRFGPNGFDARLLGALASLEK